MTSALYQAWQARNRWVNSDLAQAAAVLINIEDKDKSVASVSRMEELTRQQQANDKLNGMIGS